MERAHLDTTTGTQPSGCRGVSIAPCCSVNAAFLFAEPRMLVVVSRCARWNRRRILTLPPRGKSGGGAPVSDVSDPAFLVRARAKAPCRRPALRWQCQDAPSNQSRFRVRSPTFKEFPVSYPGQMSRRFSPAPNRSVRRRVRSTKRARGKAARRDGQSNRDT